MATEEVPILELQRGNPASIPMVFSDDDGAYNLTDKTILYTAKLFSDEEYNDDATAVIKGEILPAEHTIPLEGKTTLELSITDTTVAYGRLKSDFRVLNDAGVQINSCLIYTDVVPIVTTRTS